MRQPNLLQHNAALFAKAARSHHLARRLRRLKYHAHSAGGQVVG